MSPLMLPNAIDRQRPSLEPKPVVAIFAEPLLAPSMTFVRAQGSALREFTALYVSPQRASPGLPLPSDRTVVLCDNPRAPQLWNRLKQIPELRGPGIVAQHDGSVR